MSEIQLHNSLTRKKDPLVPIDPGNVGMYVCGPTVYDRAHLGNARPAVVFDVLFRLLRHAYGPEHVTYVRNITDVDDKINARARETGRPISEITAETARWYMEDMAALGVLEPTHQPRATAYIPQMVEMIETLMSEGHAYAREGHVLFDVDSWRERYGRLSGRSVDDMIAGARVEVAPYKRNPMDFVLWKPSAEGEPAWPGPKENGVEVSRGRPGWHIECSAMATELLGPEFDIHGGGNDLMFPHHENEIAQSCCANHTERMARIWMHNEMLQVEGRKMSKSLGNFFTVHDLLDGNWSGGWKVPGEVIRFVFLQTHYRKPMDWTERKAREAWGHLGAWHRFKRHALSDPARSFSGEGVDEEVIAALSDDLNTPLIFQRRLFELAGDAKMSSVDSPEVERFFETLAFLGFLDLDVERHSRRAAVANAVTSRIGVKGGSVQLLPGDLARLRDRLVEARAEAQATRDFGTVDALKRALVDAGVEVRMSKDGVELVPGPDFDPAKLEAIE